MLRILKKFSIKNISYKFLENFKKKISISYTNLRKSQKKNFLSKTSIRTLKNFTKKKSLSIKDISYKP